MSTVFRLVTPVVNEAAVRAKAALSRIPNAVVRVEFCPPAVADWFECPFVRRGNGLDYFGVDDIEFFVQQVIDGGCCGQADEAGGTLPAEPVRQLDGECQRAIATEKRVGEIPPRWFLHRRFHDGCK